MIKPIYLKYLVFILFFFNGRIAFCQEQFSEIELKKKADALFESENYFDALPLYTQLYSNFKDPEYTYKIGACKLFTEKDKEAPLFYLESAAKKLGNKMPDLYYYLAKAYHINYRFAEAIKYYKLYETTGRKRGKLPVKREVEMCENGKKLLQKVTDIQVLEKKQLALEDFYKGYNLAGISGKLLRKPEEFKSKKDKALNEETVFFSNPGSNTVFYSSYGEDGSKGKEIYSMTKNEKGEFATPTNLGTPINTEFDEEFPFLTPDGKTLYFASKGHNSMGGYDIFKSEFDEGIKKWSSPQNLDFAINSPGDDYMFITNPEGDVALFASTRESTYGNVAVYKVKTSRSPVNTVVLQGKFSSPFATNPEITVKNTSTDQVVGVFKADSTGNYYIPVPSGNKYSFLVDADSSKSVHSGIVTVPKQTTSVGFEQEIVLEKIGTEENLKIVNKFDKPIPIQNETAQTSLLKQMEKLEVSAKEEAPEVKVDAPITANPEIVTWANSEAENKLMLAKLLKQKANELMVSSQLKDAVQNKELTDKMITKADDYQKEAETLSSNANQYNANPSQNEAILKDLKAQKSDVTAQRTIDEVLTNLYHDDIKTTDKQIDKTEKELVAVNAEKDYLKEEIIKLDQEIKKAKKDDKAGLVSQKTGLEAELKESESLSVSLKQKLQTLQFKQNYNKQKNTEASLALAPLKTEVASAPDTINKVNIVSAQEIKPVSPEASDKKDTLQNLTFNPVSLSTDSLPKENYNPAFENSIAELDKSDKPEVEKQKTKMDLYDQWINKINDDIVYKIHTASTLPDQDVKKEQLLIQIKQLEALKEEKEKLMADAQAKSTITVQNTPQTQSTPSSSKPAENLSASIENMHQQEENVLSDISSQNQNTYQALRDYEALQPAADSSINDIEKINYLQALNEKEITFIDEKITQLQSDSANTNTIKSLTQLKEVKLKKNEAYNAYIKQQTVSENIAQNRSENVNKQAFATPTKIAPSNDAYIPETNSINYFNETSTNALIASNTQKIDSLQKENETLNQTYQKQNGEVANTKGKKKKAAKQAEADATLVKALNKESEVKALSEISNHTSKIKETSVVQLFDKPNPNNEYQAIISAKQEELSTLESNRDMKTEELAKIKKKKKRKPVETEIASLNRNIDAKKHEIQILKDEETNMNAVATDKVALALLQSSDNAKTTPLTSKELKQAEVETLLADPSYQEFQQTETEYKTYQKASADYYKQANEKRKLANDLNDRAIVLMNEANQEPNDEEKAKKIKQAEVITLEAQQLQSEIEEIEKQGNDQKIKAEGLALKNAQLVLTKDDDFRRNLAAMRQGNVEQPVIIVDTAKPLVDSTQIASETTNDEFTIFEENQESAYSKENPIPVNAPMPDGLIYKVQIGAFKNPIPQDVFKGFKPIVGETANNGFTRYMAGNFKELDNASGVRNLIRNMGYKDAFVVAYLNGKRVPINQAQSPQTIASVSASSTQNTTNQPNEEDGLAIVSNTWDQIKGVHYTVQVGVYKNTPKSKTLSGINPLYVDKLPSGLSRYTTGLFTEIEQANANKNLMVDIGIKDAFITAYKDGQRVTIEEAKGLLQDKSSIKASSPSTNGNTPNGSTIYTVQIGAYSDQIPVDEVENYIKIGEKYPIISKKDKGLYIYSAGSFNTQQEAEKVKNEINSNYPFKSFVISISE